MEFTRPTLRGFSHRYAFFVALGAGAVLVASTRAAHAIAATAIYAATLAALFGISAAYHHHAGAIRTKLRWKRADHAMIFVFIAGTYTPVALLGVGGADGWRLLIGIWTGAALGALQAVCWTRAPRVVTTGLYLALGWAMVWYWPLVRAHLDAAPLALLVIGGLLYTVGALVYALRRPDPVPLVFGYHEVFHALVIAGSACHFVMILLVVRG